MSEAAGVAVSTEVAREITERLAGIRERIASACVRAGRAHDSVTLIGVSKRQPAERIAAAIQAGVRDLGENYVQELRDKRPAVEALLAPGEASTVRWHMIGNLQRNKARAAIELVDAVDTVDGARLAAELDKRAATAGRLLDICLQVNLSGEAQKSGVAAEALPELLAACALLGHLRVVGLMTVPAADPDPEGARPVFARLRALRDTLSGADGGRALRELSMGMSGDFETAIEEGATLVRVGTALFGARTP